MEYQLYRKLEEGEVIEAGDFCSQLEGDVVSGQIGKPFSEAERFPIFRPVSSANRKPDDSSPVVGIPLRAYFAGLAMQGMMASSPTYQKDGGSVHVNYGNDDHVKALAKASTRMADALIAALEGKESE